MKKQVSLLIKHFFSNQKSSDMQTLRLFAILAGLTLIFVVLLNVVQFSPANRVQDEIKAASEAKIAP